MNGEEQVKGQYKSTGQLIAYYQVRITIKIVAHLKREKNILTRGSTQVGIQP